MIIVTGAYGFIGVYLVDELRRQGCEVLATGHRASAACYFQRRGIAYATLDLGREEDFRSLPRKGVEAVVHLGGLLPANVEHCRPQDYIRVNTLGTINLLEYCRNCGIPKIIATTSYADVQNAWRVSPPLPPDTPRDFRYTGDHAMYVFSKNTASDAILHYNAEYQLQGSIFRLPPVYGYGPHLTIYVDGKPYRSGFHAFLDKARAGEPIEIWGDPEAVRDVVYVKDVVQAFAKALRSPGAVGVYNVSSGVGLSLHAQAKAMVAAFSPPEKRSKIVLRPDRPNNIRPYVFDISKAARDFGYCPAYTFPDMLADYIQEERAGTYSDLVSDRRKPWHDETERTRAVGL